MCFKVIVFFVLLTVALGAPTHSRTVYNSKKLNTSGKWSVGQCNYYGWKCSIDYGNNSRTKMSTSCQRCWHACNAHGMTDSRDYCAWACRQKNCTKWGSINNSWFWINTTATQKLRHSNKRELSQQVL